MAQARVMHYLNQFFAGMGAEDKADVPPGYLGDSSSHVFVPWLCYGCSGNDYPYHTHFLSFNNGPGLRPDMVWDNNGQGGRNGDNHPTGGHKCICHQVSG